jgi:hypothetical protein
MATWAKWDEEIDKMTDRELFDLQKNFEGTLKWEFLSQEFEGLSFVKKLVDSAVTRRLACRVKELSMKSLNDVDKMYRGGYLSEEVTEAYIRAWNEGPVFTKAVLKDGGIRTISK